MSVKLLAHTHEPEKLVASAAKLCYSASDIETLMDNLTEENVNKFIEKLSSMGHESPFEHISFTFGIEGVSRALLAQITRHRIASYSVQSQRYVDMTDFDYVTPPVVLNDPVLNKEYAETMSYLAVEYEHFKNSIIASIIFEKHQSEMEDIIFNIAREIEKNDEVARATAKEVVTYWNDEENSPKEYADRIDFWRNLFVEKFAENNKKLYNQISKTAQEDARFVLPNACTTKMMVTMNARSLFNFFKLRCCARAQWEIRELAIEMLALVKEIAPQIFKYAGPGCVRGKCTEGAMSCGVPFKMPQKN